MLDVTSLFGNPYELARYFMWCRLIPGWEHMNKVQRNRKRQPFSKQEPSQEDRDKVVEEMLNSLGTFTAHTQGYPVITNCVINTNKKEETMYNETEDQRRYLRARLSDITTNHVDNLQKAFHMNSERPETFTEALKRLREGKFTLISDEVLADRTKSSGEYFDSYLFENLFNWRTAPADVEGYNAAYDKMETARIEAKDKISILPPEQGLEALKAFESATFR